MITLSNINNILKDLFIFFLKDHFFLDQIMFGKTKTSGLYTKTSFRDSGIN